MQRKSLIKNGTFLLRNFILSPLNGKIQNTSVGHHRANVIFGKAQGGYTYSSAVYVPNADKYNIVINEVVCTANAFLDVSKLQFYQPNNNGFCLRSAFYADTMPGYSAEVDYTVTPKT